MSQKRKLVTNFLSLSSVQVANYIFPLITVPYLVRVLGPDRFGAISFSQAFIHYFVLITDYGFNLSATKKVSIIREDKAAVGKLISSTLIIKTGLLLLSLLILLSICSLVPVFKRESLLYLITFGYVLGNAFTPTWLFQGLEKMTDLATVNMIGRIIFTTSIFFLVKHQSDYLAVAGINSIAQISVSAISLYIILRRYKIKFFMPRPTDIISELKDGWHVFISTLAISLYTVSNTIILGIFTNNTIVGYYSAGEKIIRAVQNMMVPAFQTIYPHISKLASDSKEQALAFARKAVRLIGAPAFLLSSVLLVLAPQINKFVLGSSYEESIAIMRLLSFLPFLICLSNIFAVQVMLNFGLEKAFSKIMMAASIINIMLALTLVMPLQHIGIAVSLLVTETFVTIASLFFIQSNDLKVLWGIAHAEVK